MTTKEHVLTLLEKNRGTSLSGEEIAQSLGISRAAVWKAVRALSQEGYGIEAVTRLGYRLSPDCDLLSAQAIEAFLPEKFAHVYTYRSLESTNDTAKALAADGCKHGTTVIADMQTGGRGRYGRSFSSPSGGLYMSVVLRAQDPTTLTAAAAVAVCRAIENQTEHSPQIKWVNDILIDKKKVCGILSEAVVDLESGGVSWVVVGIGINLDRSAIPPELCGAATALFANAPGGTVRARLAAEILKNLLPAPPSGEAMRTAYRERLSMLGQSVAVHAPDGVYNAVAQDIDEQCRLAVILPDGTRRALSSGEVSVKL